MSDWKKRAQKVVPGTDGNQPEPATPASGWRSRAMAEDAGSGSANYGNREPSGTVGNRREPPDPGLGRTLASQFLSGVMKQGSDEATGALGRALNPGAVSEVDDGAELYRTVRDRERAVLEGGREARPVASFLANVGGDVASDFLLSRAGVPVTSSAYQTATGALSGLMGSDADLSEGKASAGNAVSAGASTALGGALGYLAPKVGQAVTRHVLPGAMSRLRQMLDDTAISQGRRVLENVSTTLSGRRPTSDDAVREALESGAIRGFRTTRDAFEELERLASQQGASYGTILERLEAMGVQGPRAQDIANRLMERARATLRTSGADEAIPNLFRDNAEAVMRRPDPGFAMPERELLGPPQQRLGLGQAEEIKRGLQDKARWDRINTTGLEDARKEVASTYRQSIEDTIREAGEAAPAGSEVAQMAEEFLPVKQRLARTLEAREAAERGTMAGAKRSKMGLTDYLTGNAAASMGLGPFGAIMAGTTNNLLRGRGTSALASGSYRAGQAAGAVGRFLTENPRTAQALGAFMGGVGGRQLLQAELLRRRLSDDPPTTQEAPNGP